MSIIWSGITEEGAVVPVQVDDNGKVIATADVADNYVLKSGDTMTGPLKLPGDPVQNKQASTKAYVDTSVAGVQAPSSWASVQGDGTVTSAFGVDEVTKNGTGVFNVTFTDSLNNNGYCVLANCSLSTRFLTITDKQNEGFTIQTFDEDDVTPRGSAFNFCIFSTQDEATFTYTE